MPTDDGKSVGTGTTAAARHGFGHRFTLMAADDRQKPGCQYNGYRYLNERTEMAMPGKKKRVLATDLR